MANGVLPCGIFKKGKQQDDGTNGMKRVKMVKTGVFFVFGENFKMLNVVICVLRHFLGDW